MRLLICYICLLAGLVSCDDSQPENVADNSSEPKVETQIEPEELEFPSPLTIYKPLNYTEVGQRKKYRLKNEELHALLSEHVKEEQDASLEDEIYFTLDLTADKISFTTEKCSTDPNKVFDEGETHCVGYSAFFNSVMNFLIQKRGWKDRFKAKHLIGKIDMLGADLHKVIDDPFFKDHDFNKIEDLETGEAVYVDPSLYDYIGVVWVKVSEH